MSRKQRHPEDNHSSNMRNRRLEFCLWLLFGVGLLVQASAPGLKIEDRAFVMPPVANLQGATIRPDLLVRRERWMQGASGILTVGSALALGLFYRRTLLFALKG